MSNRGTIRALTAACVLGAMLATGAPARAQIVFYNAPTNNSTLVSFHNATGPVLADDFSPASSGRISSVTWWGSALPAPGANTWELAFHTNAPAGQPNIDDPFQGALVKYVNVVANGVAVPSLPGIFRYTADLTGLVGSGAPFMTVSAGAEYWFTAANTTDGWTWADALLGPVIGSEQFNAHQSVDGAGLCGDGGPHCGPWIDRHTDLAFAVSAVPEPGTYALVLTGLGFVGLLARRRRAGGSC